MRHESPKTARFNFYWRGVLCRMALRDGQTLNHGCAWDTDEGWDSEYFTLSRDGDTITWENFSDGCDCDGRMSDGFRVACHVSELSNNPNFYKVLLPNWQKESEYHRDYSAEAAGY